MSDLPQCEIQACEPDYEIERSEEEIDSHVDDHLPVSTVCPNAARTRRIVVVSKVPSLTRGIEVVRSRSLCGSQKMSRNGQPDNRYQDVFSRGYFANVLVFGFKPFRQCFSSIRQAGDDLSNKRPPH